MNEWLGKPVADAMTADLTARVETLKARGVLPTLAVLRVGEKEEDLAYERGLTKRFAAAGAEVRKIVLPADTDEETLEKSVAELNADPAVHGILLFLPLPKHLNEARVRELVSPEKDVDCMGEANAFAVYDGRKKGFAPCTPQAVIELLDFYGYDLTGKRVTVVGRSRVVGKPLSMLLLARNATVTICHTRTVDLPAVCKEADLLVCCAGSARMIGSEFVKPGMSVVDVGINACEGGICGDVDFDAVAPIVEAITPVPRGVGSVTNAVLLKHVVESAERA